MWTTEHACEPSCYFFKCLFQIFTETNGSKFDFSNIPMGRGSSSPSPDSFPNFCLRFRSRFSLRHQFSGTSRPRLVVHPRFSSASRSRFGLRPQFLIGDLGCPPKKKNSSYNLSITGIKVLIKITIWRSSCVLPPNSALPVYFWVNRAYTIFDSGGGTVWLELSYLTKLKFL